MPFHTYTLSSGLASIETTPAILSYVGMEPVFYIPPTIAHEMTFESIAGVTGDDPDTEVFRTINGSASMGPHRYYHFRFIVVPAALNLNNPTFNTDVPFHLWNTFPFPDELISGALEDTTVVTTDLTTGSDILDFEWAEYNIQIGPGETELDARLIGTYTQGSFTLAITGILIVDMPLIPEEKVSETWQWSTSITTSYDNTEQRVRLAPGPIRVVEYTYETDEIEMVEVMRRLFQSTVGLITVPFYQYATKLTQNSSPGDNELFFNPSYTNLRVGDTIYLRDPLDESLSSGIIQVIESMTPTGCIIEATLGSTVRAGWTICPAFPLYLEEPTQTFKSVSGNLRITGRAADRSRPLLRAGATATLTTFQGLPVIDQRTLAGITEGPITPVEIFDSGFGKQRRVSTWPYAQFQRSVKFFCPLKKSMDEFDKWMLFFDTVAGAHKPFFLPSGLADLEIDTPPINSGNSFTLVGVDYSSIYFKNPTYKQLMLTRLDGTILYRTVASASVVGGKDVLTITPDLPDDIESNPVARVSFLYRVRMATDMVDVKFVNNRAYFSFGVMGTST